MATRVLAKVRPEILVWARESAGFTPEETAAAIHQSLDNVISWENGTASPSIPQLRELSHLYKRPLSVFYLQEPPRGFMAISDFRRTSPERPRRFSPQLTQEIRFANQRRELAKELLEDLGEQPNRFMFSLSMKDNPDEAGLLMREHLGLSRTAQPFKSDSTGRTGLNLWRSRIEQSGVLVFQTMRIPSEEASGFALAYEDLPVIVVNQKDAPVRRLFSLLHELAHLALRKSGVSDLDVESPRPPEDERLEVFCNRVAASALMPESLFLSDKIVLEHGKSPVWNDGEIALLSARFGSSREAVVRRLLSFHRTNKAFYLEKREQYRQEYIAKREQQAAARPNTEIKRNMAQEAISNYGWPLVGLVLQHYHQDRLTLSEVSGYLGLRTHHVFAIEQKLGAS